LRKSCQFFAVHLGRSLINNETFDITKRLVEGFPSVTQNVSIGKGDRCCEILRVLPKVTKRLLGRVNLGVNWVESFENQLGWRNYSDI
jgi:hypothetical protein